MVRFITLNTNQQLHESSANLLYECKLVKSLCLIRVIRLAMEYDMQICEQSLGCLEFIILPCFLKSTKHIRNVNRAHAENSPRRREVRVPKLECRHCQSIFSPRNLKSHIESETSKLGWDRSGAFLNHSIH